jgi:phosphatidylinositol alpha-1,6-mannosyltransferase
MRLLVITNDFPPRPGGIQQYVHNLLVRLDEAEVTVLTSRWEGWETFDATQPFEVVRAPTGMLLPTRSTLRQALELIGQRKPDLVLFGAAFPLGLLAGRITAATGVRCVGFSHGVEVAMAAVPVARRLMGKVAADLGLLTAVSGWAARRVQRAAGRRCPVELLVSGVSVDDYHPLVDGTAVRAANGLADDPVCVCVSRLVPRKGQDALIQAWPQVLATVPSARLLLVGGGPYERRLRRLAGRAGPAAERIHFTGPVPWAALPAHYAAGDVFAMPCRTRWGGLDLEALGVVFLEAAAAGLPVVAGDSGGAPETVQPGATGLVVDGRSRAQVAGAVAGLLADPERARAWGAAGRRRVEAEFAWSAVARRFAALLERAAA